MLGPNRHKKCEAAILKWSRPGTVISYGRISHKMDILITQSFHKIVQYYKRIIMILRHQVKWLEEFLKCFPLLHHNFFKHISPEVFFESDVHCKKGS